MWFLVIQILALIAAAVRGWKFWPFLIWGCLLVFGAVMGAGGLSTGEAQIVQFFDIVATGVFLLMAIVGRKSESQSSADAIGATPPDMRPRVPCPNCAELIVSGATVCRFCGKSVNERSSIDTVQQQSSPDGFR